MQTPSLALTPDNLELIEFAQQIVDANTDGPDGMHTMGAAFGHLTDVVERFTDELEMAASMPRLRRRARIALLE
jgi:hypothetical protein